MPLLCRRELEPRDDPPRLGRVVCRDRRFEPLLLLEQHVDLDAAQHDADIECVARAMTEARLTHHDPLAGEVAAAASKLCRALIRGAAWQDAVEETGSFTGQEEPGNNGGYAPDVLRAALYFVGTSACFTEALDR